MPRISSFYGIVITMHWREHPPPHFHAIYGGESAQISIDTLELINGSLPPRALRLIRDWGEEHRLELEDNWERARAQKALEPIEPLP
ncbi:MAG: DUF4160 domain-containing protein [Solirubrobacterales bacterium]|nr:MAG: DUF4160 domain-containing protein [Solirubrobacterales bacterium]